MTDTEPAHTLQVRSALPSLFLRDGLVTIAVMAIAFAAFDDITTGNETDFRLEYRALLVCLMWLMFVAVRLMRLRHRMLGIVSLAALAGAMWGLRQIGGGISPGMWPGYLVTAGAMLWFVVLSGVLLVLALTGRNAIPREARLPDSSA